jgi:hypothetical protein
MSSSVCQKNSHKGYELAELANRKSSDFFDFLGYRGQKTKTFCSPVGKPSSFRTKFGRSAHPIPSTVCPKIMRKGSFLAELAARNRSSASSALGLRRHFEAPFLFF